ncbi:hypothetical protein M5K25_010982 [Dendrobium thyrsiflorum]|uniref:RNase H type-1 domain-containing protein n=1 Tax=Dendrobium thyrsiflorum TaxID=117978 RepID=A0ABD0V1U6_DENTH
MHKYVILLGKFVDLKKKKKAISRMLDFKVVKELSYIGVKVALRRLVAADFQSMLERALNKLNTWSNKFILLEGRLVLVKSVLLSIPIFLATHSLVPMGVLYEIDKMCRDFIWHKKDGKFALHYVAWIVLCKSKNHGGHGLHSIVSKVGSIRAKFSWNFIVNPKSLLNRSLKAKYGSDIWNAEIKRGCSSTWKIIVNGIMSLRLIVRWDVANGESINALNDVWIIDRSLKRWPTYVAELEGMGYGLNNFISDGLWDEEQLRRYFGKYLVELILQVPINFGLINDRVEMKAKITGKTIAGMISENLADVSGEDKLWNWVRNLKVRPCVHLFWWRLCIDAIPSNAFLSHKRLSNQVSCPKGCGVMEDENHIAAGCFLLILMIKLLNKWSFQVPIFSSFWGCINKLKSLSLNNPFVGNLYCTAVFLSWKSRNKRIHGEKEDGVVYIATNAIYFASVTSLTYIHSGIWDANQLLQLPSDSWHPPPPEWIKVNVDGSLTRSNRAGVGRVQISQRKVFACIWLYGVTLECISGGINGYSFVGKDWMGEARGIIIEGGNYNVIKYLQRSFEGSKAKPKDLLDSHLAFLKDFDQVIFSFCNRNCNKLADLCANYALFNNFIYDDVSSVGIPSSFVSLLKEECDGLP